MVNALVQIDENTNRVLNIIKAKYDLKDKGEAIAFIIKQYIEQENEPELKPEFIKKIHEIERQKSIQVEDFSKTYGLN